MATDLEPSFIIKILESNSLSISSKVVNFSPSKALSTTIVLLSICLASNACIGWPSSNITKLVMSTILFIGLTPASKSLSCIHPGDGLTLTFFTPLAIYLLHNSSLTSTFNSSLMFDENLAS